MRLQRTNDASRSFNKSVRKRKSQAEASAMPSDSRYWCAVACREHVKLAVSGGFAQACHGKRGPLARMRARDGIVYYSPTFQMNGKQKCQAFTSIGFVKDEKLYSFQMAPGFIPFRRDIEYWDAVDAPIKPLLQHLSFTRDRRNWGYSLRSGHFEITRQDFIQILSQMNPMICAKRFGSPEHECSSA
jgi:hypothetical protein